VARRAWQATAVVAFAVGLAYRLQDFGRYGFWTDEAYVALATRVSGWPQIWLAAGPTPIGFVLVVRAMSWLGGPVDLVLRLVPLACSIAAMLLAHRIGTRVVGHPAGGALALAAVAIEPYSIEMSKLLKQYATEGFTALLALDAACAVVLGTASPARLAAIVALGAPFANTQLLVGPAAFTALAVDAVARRDGKRLRATIGWGAVAAAALAAVYVVLVVPKMSGGLVTWHAPYFAPADSVGVFLAFSRDWIVGTVAGPLGIVGSLLAIVLLPFAGRAGPVLAGIVALLAIEMLALGALEKYPIVETRVVAFYLVVVAVSGATALAWTGVRLATSTSGRAVVLIAALAITADLARRRDFAHIGQQPSAEDLGPLVRTMLAERGADERVLVYDRSSYVYAYYAEDPPVLVPVPQNSIGYVPQIASATLVAGHELRARIVEALAASPRVWVLASRVRPGDEQLVGRALAAGTTLRRETRARAFLVVLARVQS
jgi:hypothetical protein